MFNITAKSFDIQYDFLYSYRKFTAKNLFSNFSPGRQIFTIKQDRSGVITGSFGHTVPEKMKTPTASLYEEST